MRVNPASRSSAAQSGSEIYRPRTSTSSAAREARFLDRLSASTPRYLDCPRSIGQCTADFPHATIYGVSVRMSYIIAKVAEKIGTITLNDERHRNALSKHLVEQAISALQSFRETKVRVVIVRARQGAKVFSAGHDV